MVTLLHPVRRSLYVLALLAAPACGNPAPEPGVDPRGNDATFNFSWLIDGQDPTDPSDPCTAANVRFIRMNVVGRGDGGVIDAFRFDCRLGRHRSAVPELRAGTYQLFWEAVRADGTRVSVASGTYVNGVLQPTLEEITVERGGHIDFDARNRPDLSFPPAPTNFATGRGPLEVALQWASAPGATQGSDCATAGVATVSWTLRLSNHVAIEQHTTPESCAAGYGTLRWNALDFDRYKLEVQGYHASGQLGWRGTCSILVTRGSAARQSCLVDRVAGP